MGIEHAQFQRGDTCYVRWNDERQPRRVEELHLIEGWPHYIVEGLNHLVSQLSMAHGPIVIRDRE